MDLSKYDTPQAEDPALLKLRYHELRARLEQLLAAADKDMKAVDAVIVELDEVQASLKRLTRRPEDTQRY